MKNALIGLTLLFSSTLFAQEKMKPNVNATQSIDGIVKEVLRIVSGEKGEKRDLESFRDLFLPTAQFTVHSHSQSVSNPVETVDLDEFIDLLKDPYYEQGYSETEISKVVDEYNGIAQVFQTYQARDSEGVEEKGITSYQLVHFNARWWIVNVLWTGNSNGVEIPDHYLGK